METKDVLLLFSGGRDSFLSACMLIEQGYKIYMVTFENGASLHADNARHGANRIVKKYGKDKAVFLGTQSVFGIWREFFLPYFNMKPSDVIKEYGELPISQFHCLSCRMAMYIWCVIQARQMNIKYIADGAREDQGFVIELPSFLSVLKEFLANYGIEILLPVHALDSDQKRKNQLLIRGFTPKTLEPQCLLGVPIPGNQPLSEDIQKATIKFFERVIKERAQSIIEENKNTNMLTSGKFV